MVAGTACPLQHLNGASLVLSSQPLRVGMAKVSTSPCGGATSCPLCIANRKGRSANRGHSFYVQPREAPRQWRSVMQKPTSTPVGATKSVRPPDLGYFLKCPRIAEHLCDESWDDGTERQRSTLSVFIESGVFKVCLNDRETGSSMIVAGESLATALVALEARLAGDKPADWRKWKKGKFKS